MPLDGLLYIMYSLSALTQLSEINVMIDKFLTKLQKKRIIKNINAGGFSANG